MVRLPRSCGGRPDSRRPCFSSPIVLRNLRRGRRGKRCQRRRKRTIVRSLRCARERRRSTQRMHTATLDLYCARLETRTRARASSQRSRTSVNASRANAQSLRLRLDVTRQNARVADRRLARSRAQPVRAAGKRSARNRSRRRIARGRDHDARRPRTVLHRRISRSRRHRVHAKTLAHALDGARSTQRMRTCVRTKKRLRAPKPRSFRRAARGARLHLGSTLATQPRGTRQIARIDARRRSALGRGERTRQPRRRRRRPSPRVSGRRDGRSRVAATGVLDGRNDGDGPAGRLGHGRRRPVGDPARLAADHSRATATASRPIPDRPYAARRSTSGSRPRSRRSPGAAASSTVTLALDSSVRKGRAMKGRK